MASNSPALDRESMTSDHTFRLAVAVRDAMDRNHQTLATLESCTGGLVASALTDVPGAGYLLGGGIAYDPAIKEAFGVRAETIERFGVVSSEVALSLSEAAAAWFSADIGVGVTGFAGPGEAEGIEPGSGFAAISRRGSPGRSVALQVTPWDRRTAKEEMTDLILAFLLEEVDRFRPQGCLPAVEAWIGR